MGELVVLDDRRIVLPALPTGPGEGVVRWLEAAEPALAQLESIDEVKGAVAAGATVAVWARQMKSGEDLIARGQRFVTRARRRRGQLIEEAREQGQIRSQGRPGKGGATTGISDLGVTEDEGRLDAQLAEPSDQQFEKALAQAEAEGAPTPSAVAKRLRPASEPPKPAEPVQDAFQATRDDRVVAAVEALGVFVREADAAIEQMPVYLQHAVNAETLGKALSQADAAIEALREAVKLVAPEYESATRPRNALWDAIAFACYGTTDWNDLTKVARGRARKAWGDLHRLGATPDEVRERAATYREHYPDREFTPTALAASWNALAGLVGKARARRNGTRDEDISAQRERLLARGPAR
jgi:hypothetical protein